MRAPRGREGGGSRERRSVRTTEPSAPEFPRAYLAAPQKLRAVNTMASEIDNLNSHEAKTVCEALGRYEDMLRGAVREIHVDIQVFKQGVSRQVDEVLRLASPLARTVSELQQENQRLRVQLERLARQVEALSRSAGLPQEWQDEAERSPPAVGPSSPVPAFSADRFSTLAKLAVSGRSQVSAGCGWGGNVGRVMRMHEHLL